jgi:mono/diheme cytochrome c family protein
MHPRLPKRAFRFVVLQPSYLVGRAMWVAGALACVIAGAAVSVGAYAAQAGAGTASIRADVLYHNYCSVCHGDRGDGRSRARGSLVPPPRDFTAPEAIEQLTRERMIASVTHGRPGTAMVGWSTQLNAAEIAALADYIRATFMAPRTSPALARGRDIYARNCAVCHGDHGQGAVWAGANMQRPPRNFTSPQAAAELDRSRMIAAVTQGRPGTAMSAFGAQLSGADIEAVVDFIRTAFMMPAIEGLSGTHAHLGRDAAAPGRVADTVDMRAPLPKGLKGNAARGKRFYLANCATCHGARGDGQGPRAYFIRPKPRNFLDPAAQAALNRPALFAAIALGKVGTEMPAWSKVLSDQQIANVAEFVFVEFIRPGPPSASAAKRSSSDK